MKNERCGHVSFITNYKGEDRVLVLGGFTQSLEVWDFEFITL